MTGLSAELYEEIRTTLLRCGPFESDRALEMVFVHPDLLLWRDAVPQARSAVGRVAAVIDFLLDKQNADGENALVLFLRALSAQIDPGDICHHNLTRLADRLDAALKGEDLPFAKRKTSSPILSAPISPPQASILRAIIIDRFNSEELRSLCMDLGVDYESLPAMGKAGKARELIAYLRRRSRLPKLIDWIRYTRPDIDLDSLMIIGDWETDSPSDEFSPQVSIEKQRRIDAAIPSQAEVGQAIDLLIQVRFPDSELLGIKDWPVKRKPHSLEQESSRLNLQFPIDSRTGRVGSAFLDIEVVAPGFRIVKPDKQRVEVPPDEFSNCIQFLLIAEKGGRQKINILVRTADGITVGTIPVDTIVGETTGTPTATVANMFLFVMVQSPSDASQLADVMPPPPIEEAASPRGWFSKLPSAQQVMLITGSIIPILVALIGLLGVLGVPVVSQVMESLFATSVPAPTFTPTPTSTSVPTSTPTPTIIPSATPTPSPTSQPCYCASETNSATWICLIQSESEAANTEDMELVLEIFAEDATIFDGSTEEEWLNPISHYVELFTRSDFSNLEHFDVEIVESSADRALLTSGSRGIYTPSGGEPEQIENPNPSDHWIFETNEQGCWVITRFEFNASHIPFP